MGCGGIGRPGSRQVVLGAVGEYTVAGQSREGGNQSSGRGRGGRSQGTPSIGVTRFCPPIKLLELCFERGVPQQYAGNKAGSEIWVLRSPTRWTLAAFHWILPRCVSIT